METLKEEQQQQSDDHRLAKISLPTEIIEDIFSRLPVKSILRFKTLSKPWLARISNPSLTKLHLTRATAAHRTALFIYAYDYSTYQLHLLSAAHDGGPLTHLMTLADSYSSDVIFTEAQHLNGLVCFTCMDSDYNSIYNFVINPTTHHIFKLPDQEASVTKSTYRYRNLCYSFGFDDFTNEHKLLNFRKRKPLAASSNEPSAMEVVIFSLSGYAWSIVDTVPPIGFTWDFDSLWIDPDFSVCVNSVVHLFLLSSYDILAFDLRTETFSVINTPRGVMPDKDDTLYITKKGEISWKENKPRIRKINGCVGVVCHEYVLETNEMHIWILQDYENRVWIREIITFPESWVELGEPFPEDSINTDEIIFSGLDQDIVPVSEMSNVSGNVMSVLVYNRKSKCFKSLQFNSSHHFPLSKTLRFDHIRCYVESMMHM